MLNFLVKSKNKNAEIFTASMFLLSLVFLISAAIGLRPKALCQFFCIAFLALGILIANRYLLSSFCYIIKYSELPVTLSVLQKQGKREFTVCRIDFDKICGYEIVGAGGKASAEKKCGKITASFNYCASLFPARYVLLFYQDVGGSQIIKLEADESFIDNLLDFLQDR